MNWPKDNTAACKAFYGDPTGANGQPSRKWMAENLIMVPVPWKMVLAWDTSKSCKNIQIHRKCGDALLKAMQGIAAHGEPAIRAAGLHLYGGSFNYRVKRGLSSLSVHAFGAAADFDPERNGLGDMTPYMPEWVVAEFKKVGAVWGGDFKRRDGMHFQFATI